MSRPSVVGWVEAPVVSMISPSCSVRRDPPSPLPAPAESAGRGAQILAGSL